MSAALNDQQLAAVEQQFSAHPEILQAFKTYQDWQSHRGRMAYATTGGPPTPQQVLAKYGITFPDIEDYQIKVDPQGQVKLDRQNWFNRNADWILPVATVGGGAAVNALTGGFSTPAATGTAATGYNPTGSVAGGAASGAAKGSAISDMLPGAEFAGASSPLASFLKKLALGLAPVGAGLAAHALGPTTPQPPQVPDELKQLLASAMKRMSDQQPLVDRVNAGELAGLPRLQ